MNDRGTIRPWCIWRLGGTGVGLGLLVLGGCLSSSIAESEGKITPKVVVESPATPGFFDPALNTSLNDSAIPSSVHQLLLPPMQTAAPPAPARPAVDTKGGRKVIQAARGAKEPLLDIVVDDTPARTFFLGLADESKLNLIVHPQVRGNISLTMHGATVNQVVQTVCRMYDYDCEANANGYFIGPARLLTRQYHVNYLRVQRRGVTSTQISSGRTKTSSNTMANATGNQTSSQNFQTSGTNVTTDQSASFWDEFTYSLCGILGLGFSLPESKSPASSLGGGLTTSTGSTGLGSSSAPAPSLPAGLAGVANLTAPQPASPQATATKSGISQTFLSWNSRDTDRMITGCAEQDEQGNTQTGRRVVISPQTGNVIVRAFPSELREIEYFLEQQKQDIQRQVILEAKILEVELSDGFQSGINWGMVLAHHKDQTNTMTIGGGGNMFGDQGSNPMFANKSSLGMSPANLLNTNSTPVTTKTTIDNVNGISSTTGLPANSLETKTEINSTSTSSPTNALFGGALTGTNSLANPAGALFGGAFATSLKLSDFSALIELLDAQGQVHVLSSPRIATLNNQKAVIRVGQDEQFVTDVHSETSSASVTLVPEFTTFFSGIALDVTPQISQDYGIMLHIHPTVSEVTTDEKQITLGTATQTYPMALNVVRESDSMVHAANGEVVVIGGLMKDFSTKRKAGLPILKDLPLVGDLFGSRQSVDKKTELVILMRPVIVEPGNQAWKEDLERFERRLPPGAPHLTQGGRMAEDNPGKPVLRTSDLLP
ncbi:MAG: secretin N-terminal domain-containing protein [Magnetococcales bacterium]|nr:secretin N-terminal domain-containing protein [Magnetococcales bacterium]